LVQNSGEHKSRENADYGSSLSPEMYDTPTACSERRSGELEDAIKQMPDHGGAELADTNLNVARRAGDHSIGSAERDLHKAQCTPRQGAEVSLNMADGRCTSAGYIAAYSARVYSPHFCTDDYCRTGGEKEDNSSRRDRHHDVSRLSHDLPQTPDDISRLLQRSALNGDQPLKDHCVGLDDAGHQRWQSVLPEFYLACLNHARWWEGERDASPETAATDAEKSPRGVTDEGATFLTDGIVHHMRGEHDGQNA